MKKSVKGGSSPSPALQPIEKCGPAQAQGGPRDARRTTAKPEVKRHLPQNKGWVRLTKGLGCSAGTRMGATSTMSTAPPRCHERLAGQREVWSARAGGWDERLFGDQGCWGSADTMRRPSLARKPARYSTLTLGASTLTTLVHGQGAGSD